MKHLLLSLLITSCTVTPEPLEPSPVDPAPVGSCAESCGHFAAMGCGVSESPDGVPCVEACERTEEFEPMNHACIIAADNCATALECEE